MSTELIRVAFVEGIGDQHRWLHVACSKWPNGPYDILFTRHRGKWDNLARYKLTPSTARAIVRLLQAHPDVVQVLVRPYRLGVRVRRGADWGALAATLKGEHRWARESGFLPDWSYFDLRFANQPDDDSTRASGSQDYHTPGLPSARHVEFDRSLDIWGQVPVSWAARSEPEVIRLVERLFSCRTLMRFSVSTGRVWVVRNRAYAPEEVDAEVETAIAQIEQPVMA